jgi:hypothetical protein
VIVDGPDARDVIEERPRLFSLTAGRRHKHKAEDQQRRSSQASSHFSPLSLPGMRPLVQQSVPPIGSVPGCGNQPDFATGVD